MAGAIADIFQRDPIDEDAFDDAFAPLHADAGDDAVIGLEVVDASVSSGAMR